MDFRKDLCFFKKYRGNGDEDINKDDIEDPNKDGNSENPKYRG
jgi:hypothetical protein